MYSPWLLLVFVVLLAAFLPGAGATPSFTAQDNQGLQASWAIDDSNANVVLIVGRQVTIMRAAEAGWVQLNFRPGGCFSG